MRQFRRILVGVDITQGDRLVGDIATPPSVEAIRRASWLARHNEASVRLMYTLDVPANVQRRILEHGDAHHGLLQQANDRLAQLTKPLIDAGIQADHKVVFGRSWLELIREVLSEKHDLLVVGTRQLNALGRMIFGSTGMKLMRKCPCPVWVTKPDTEPALRSILVAHDLSPVGERALQLGAGMAELHNAPLDILHAIDDRAYGEEIAYLAEYSRAEQESEARRQIESQLSRCHLTKPAQVYVVNQAPESALLAHIERHHTELLVMGTVGRTGIPALLLGNTAERLLPELTCSVIAIKPEGFKSPVSLG